MKKIGYVLSEFPVLSQTFVGNEMRAMRRYGHEIVPLVLRPSGQQGQAEDADLVASAIWLRDIPHADAIRVIGGAVCNTRSWLPFVMRQSGLPRRSLLWSAARIAAAARRAGCTHLHAHFAQASAATAIVAARLLGISVSFVGHGFDVYAAPADLPLKLGAADAAVAVCGDMAADFARLNPAARIETIHCGVDPDRFRPERRDTNDRTLRLLFIGRLVDSKGLDDLLCAMDLARIDVRLTVVGDGPERPELEQLARVLGIESAVDFVGPKPSAWIAAEAPRHDLLVAPFREGRNGTRDTGPVVAKEALAMGLPVLASSFMGLKEIVDDSCGRLFPTRDVRALAATLTELAGLSPAARRQLGEAGRRRVLERFTLARQASQLSNLVEAL